MPGFAPGDVLNSASADTILSKSLDKLLKPANGSPLDANLKSAHHSSLLNCPLKFKISEQANNTSHSNLSQRYGSLQNGNGERSNTVLQMKSSKHINNKNNDQNDGIAEPKITISDIAKVQLMWQRPLPVGSGLRNLGNSCFMNSVLQCLTYLAPLYNALVENNHAGTCCYKGFCSLCEVQKHIVRALKFSGSTISPTFFFNNLSKIGNFMKFKQEDAHEFLRYLLSHMEKCAVESFKAKNCVSVDATSSRTTVINNIFGGYNRSQVVCLKCKETSNTYDPFMDIMVDIKHMETLDGALMKYIKPEMLEGDNAYLCQKCKCRVPAQKRVTVHRTPAICTFQLKRFQFHNAFGSKIGKWIRFPEKLNLRPYMSDSKGPPIMYSLQGLVVHLGQSMQNGHYCAYIRGCKGNFYCMNDDMVSSVDKNKVFSQHAYILFYSKIPTVQKPNNLPKNSLQSRIVIKIKNGRVNNTDVKSTQSKSGLVPYAAEDSDNCSDQDARSAPPVNGNHAPIAAAATNGHAQDVPALNKIPDVKKLTCPVNSAMPTVVPFFKRVRRSSGSQPTASVSQSPSKLNASGSWITFDNKNQEPSVASSSSSATSFNSTVDNWTVTSHEADGRVDKRHCIGWTVESSPLRREFKKNCSQKPVVSPLKSADSVDDNKCDKVVTEVNNVNPSIAVKDSSAIPADVQKTSVDADSVELKLPGSLKDVDSDDSENSYEVEWVEKTKETIERENKKNLHEKSFQDHPKQEKKRDPSAYNDLYSGSLHGYGSSVKSWNGNVSEINLQAEREKRLKRLATDDYDLEFDRGKTKKYKHNNEEKNHNKFTRSFKADYDYQRFNRNCFKQYRPHNNYDKHKSYRNHDRHHSYHGKFHSTDNRSNHFRRHSHHSNNYRWNNKHR